MSNAKADLNVFYSKAKRPPPYYEWYPLPNPEDATLPYFGCKLYLPGTNDDQDGFESREFVGKAQNKKKAAECAAVEALGYVKSHGIFERIIVEESQGWWSRLEKLLTEVQGWKKNPFCRRYIMEAIKYNQGEILLAGMISLEPLHKDLVRKFDNRGAPYLLKRLTEDLIQNKCQRSADSKLSFNENSLSFQLSESCIERFKETYSYHFQPQKQQPVQRQNQEQEQGSIQIQDEQSSSQSQDQGQGLNQMQDHQNSVGVQDQQEQGQVSSQVDQKNVQNLDQGQVLEQQQQWVERPDLEAVLVPADVKKPPLLVKFKQGGYFMKNIADCLGCSVNHLISWGQHCPQQVKSLNPDNSPVAWGDDDKEAQNPHPQIFWQEVKEPTIYSVYNPDQNSSSERVLNPRVMWLFHGGPNVYGQVLLSTTRVTLNEYKSAVVLWRGFDVSSFWMMVNSGFPVYNYLTGINATTIGRFPAGYWSKVHWSGEDPRRLLEGYVSRKALKKPLYKTEDNLDDNPDVPLFKCMLTTQAFLRDDEAVRTEARSQGDLEIAIQTACLRALHQIQRLDMQTLGIPMDAYEEVEMIPDLVDLPLKNGAISLEDDEEEEEEGGGESEEKTSQFRTIAKINYQVSVQDSKQEKSVVVEAHPHFSVYLECGAVVKDIEDQIVKVGLDGKFKLDVKVPRAGPDVSGQIPSIPGILEAEVVEMKDISTLIGRKGAASGQLFANPVSEQRYKFVADIMQKHKCANVADLGCGDGRFIEYLLGKGRYPELKYIAGLEIASRQLDKGCNRIDRFIQNFIGDVKETLVNGVQPNVEGQNGDNTKVQDGNSQGEQVDKEPFEDVHLEQDVQLPLTNIYQGSVVNPTLTQNEVWGNEFEGIDGAAFIEVIEHITRDKTSLIAPVILGGLQPKVLVVTTPNWEYNEVLRFLGGAGRGPPGRDGHPLRDQDHKFEWDRKQFQNWALRSAKMFGYEVEFGMIGNCIEEDIAIGSSQCKVSKKVGGATQTATFVFKGHWPPLTPQISLVYSTALDEEEEEVAREVTVEEWQEDDEDNEVEHTEDQENA